MFFQSGNTLKSLNRRINLEIYRAGGGEDGFNPILFLLEQADTVWQELS